MVPSVYSMSLTSCWRGAGKEGRALFPLTLEWWDFFLLTSWSTSVADVISDQDGFKGQILHAFQHHKATDHTGKKVAVVGACTSGT